MVIVPTDIAPRGFVARSKMIKRARSRREAHKMRTRHDLREAALELFAARGYDTTTTDEISEKAGVSARTFFRYFPTKESVLFVGETAWVESFSEVYLAQADSLTDLDAMCATLVELAPGLARSRRALRLYGRAVASSPMLRGQEQEHQREDVENLAEAIAARRGLSSADEASTLLAAVGVLTYRRALDAWLTGPMTADLGAIIAEEFGLLSEAFLQEPAKRRRRPAALGGVAHPRASGRPSLSGRG